MSRYDTLLEELKISEKQASEWVGRYKNYFPQKQFQAIAMRLGICGYEQTKTLPIAAAIGVPVSNVNKLLASAEVHVRAIVQLESAKDRRAIPFAVLCDPVFAGYAGVTPRSATRISSALEKWCKEMSYDQLTAGDVDEMTSATLLAIKGISTGSMNLIVELLDHLAYK